MAKQGDHDGVQTIIDKNHGATAQRITVYPSPAVWEVWTGRETVAVADDDVLSRVFVFLTTNTAIRHRARIVARNAWNTENRLFHDTNLERSLVL